MGRGGEQVDVVVVGGGQSGLATAYHLLRRNRRRATPLTYVVLDDRDRPGAAWLDGWPSLRLFSPAGYSSLPGWPMPKAPGDANPLAQHVVDYLTAYEERYDLPVVRPVRVRGISDGDGGRLLVDAGGRAWSARAVVHATGTWSAPFWPAVPGMRDFAGTQVHTHDYRGPAAYAGQRVLVVGGGNSGAQVAADLALADVVVTWAAARPPRLLPDDVDGRRLFELATQRVQDPDAHAGVGPLGDVVAVPDVRRARDERGLRAVAMPERLTATGATWPDGTETPYDAVVWCTGFRPALAHVGRRHATEVPAGWDRGAHRVRSADDPRVWFVGYGDWCGPASATLIGVGMAARAAAEGIDGMLADG
ncbi:ArsO family NAD(P)H-dependent flavin-containing monooxygenase [Nocardioides sp. CFH 31398]|uniref:ArsO family NAD(P)H-dependent flavin-containing monooxygenase n=1 Tax=Nocardioides sp. CFH 31398 TaxID=2919579 RepID=UPI001F05A01A|nr:ArsO family NAD(P)H-dependent flavin-containing monooxygenase [Nocardioides sp. CFH 31398]MCH1865782.1 ArsO family NAD(P)H-dependent flavin-containing monooxygenase [Nocardioides sp. CFH 31398]